MFDFYYERIKSVDVYIRQNQILPSMAEMKIIVTKTSYNLFFISQKVSPAGRQYKFYKDFQNIRNPDTLQFSALSTLLGNPQPPVPIYLLEAQPPTFSFQAARCQRKRRYSLSLVGDYLDITLVGNKGRRKFTKFPHYLQPINKSLKQAE